MTTTALDVILKNVKIHPDMSEETNCFSASIYLNGKRVGTVKNSGRGGCNDYDWFNPEAGKTISDYADSLPPVQSEHFDDGLAMDIDLFIDELLREYEENRQYKSWCRTKTCFRLKTTEPGSWLTIKRKYTPQIKNALETEYGDELDEILNERF